MTMRNPDFFQSDEGLVISGTPDDLLRLAETLMLVARHPKSVRATLTDDFHHKILIKPSLSDISVELYGIDGSWESVTVQKGHKHNLR